MIKTIITPLLTLMLLTGCTGGLGVMAVGAAIVYYKTADKEVATVIFEATTKKVYEVTLNTIKKNDRVNITKQARDDGIIEVTNDQGTATITIVATDNTHTKLSITSNISSKASEKLILKPLYEVCDGLGTKCYLETKPQ